MQTSEEDGFGHRIAVQYLVFFPGEVFPFGKDRHCREQFVGYLGIQQAIVFLSGIFPGDQI